MGSLTVPSGSAPFNDLLQVLRSPLMTAAFLPVDENGNSAFAKGETPSFIPLNIAWGVDGGGSPNLHVNLQPQGTYLFSRCRMLFINNENCSVDIAVVFPDSAFPVRVPGYTSTWVPVASNALDFYVLANLSGGTAIAGDFTYIEAFNHIVPPVTVPKTEFQNTVVTAATALTGNSTTPLFATTQVIQAVQLIAYGMTGGAGAGQAAILLRDHTTGINQAGTEVSCGNAQVQAAGGQIILDLKGLNIRVQGLDLIVAISGTAFAAGNFISNVYYR